MRPAEIQRRLTVDPHAPPKFRVYGALRNLPEFAHGVQMRSRDADASPADTARYGEHEQARIVAPSSPPPRAACKQPGNGSYFAHPGPVGPTHADADAAARFAESAPPDTTWSRSAARRSRSRKTRQAAIDASRCQGQRTSTNTLEPFNDASRQLANAGEWAHLHAR